MIQTTVDSAKSTTEERLTLRSQIGDLELVPAWIEYLAAEYGVPSSTQYAMNLCLEEVLSNIIRHGYGNKPDYSIVVRYMPPGKSACLIVDDDAPPFDPLADEELSVEPSLDGTRIGGLGLRLVRNFASSLNYERTKTGNRLTIGFSAEA
jgi:serine/threonine-protein kinase RsbW